jgi:hypothetical protein
MNNVTKIIVSHHGENGMGNKMISSHLRHPDNTLRGRCGSANLDSSCGSDSGIAAVLHQRKMTQKRAGIQVGAPPKFGREKRIAAKSELRQSESGNSEAARAVFTRSNT